MCYFTAAITSEGLTMAPQPANTTGRVFIKYKANQAEHTVSLRYQGTGAPTNTFLEAIDGVLIDCNFLMPADWVFLSWAYQAQASNISLPLSGSPTAFNGALTSELADKPAMMTITGRSILGVPARLQLMGVALTPNDGAAVSRYRIARSASTNIANLLDTLAGSGIVSLEGNTPTWKQYINLGYSRYWQRQARKS
jgi:hypothetical protein